MRKPTMLELVKAQEIARKNKNEKRVKKIEKLIRQMGSINIK
jgi:hypothetical protein